MLKRVPTALSGKEIFEMPKVGGKHYSYSKAGKSKAKAAAKKSGKKVTYGKKPTKKRGGKKGY